MRTHDGGDGGDGPGAARRVADDLAARPPDWPVLIAGPTASGKSALALAVAERCGGHIINADALQVWSCWRVLSARPAPGDEARAPHHLYGHVSPGADWSVGHWLRGVAALLAALRDRGARAIIVGGTGLYLTALTEGLADIPATPPMVRAEAMERAKAGLQGLLAGIDPLTRARIDTLNPMRVMRAWEVQQATGQGLAAWQDATGPAILPLSRASAWRIEAPRDWLADRIDRRFEGMLAGGAVEEVRAVLPVWDAASGTGAPWAQAIGAKEIAGFLRGATDLPAAATLAQAASRQYAKRQRTWLRARMGAWEPLAVP